MTVIVPTYRGRVWLPDCLAALRAQTWRDFDMLVVDDASVDGTREWLADQTDVRVIRNAANQGYAAACNTAIRATDSPLVAVLNDDAQPDPGWLTALVGALDAPGRVRFGACASLMVFASRPDVVQSAGIAIDQAAIAWDRLGGQPAAAAQAPAEVFGASGGAALYRRAMLDEIGLFDAAFFAYLEDVDLAWRAQRAGWRCAYAPDARVRHATSATSGEGSAFKLRLLGRNKVWLVLKNARARDLPLIALYDLLAALYGAVRARSWAPLASRVAALARARAAWRARTRASAVVACVEPLANPFAVRDRYAHLARRPAA